MSETNVEIPEHHVIVVAEDFRFLTFHKWSGWSAEEAPEPGESVSMSGMALATGSDLDNGEDVYILIPATGHSVLTDTNLMCQSNHERLKEDFGDFVIEATGTLGSFQLYIKVGSIVPELLAEAVLGLLEYPCYDEDDYNQREWDDYQETVDMAIHDARNSYDVAQYRLSESADEVSDEFHEQVRTKMLDLASSGLGPIGEVHRSEELRFDAVAKHYTEIADELRNAEIEALVRLLNAEMFSGMDPLF